MHIERNLGERYFDWLYDQTQMPGSRSEVILADGSGPTQPYKILCDHMHRISFHATVAFDDNRMADGKSLRLDFLRELRGDPEQQDLSDFLYPDATILEVLIGLTHRCVNWASRDIGFWFWLFLKNLDLSTYTDNVYDFKDTRFIDRKLMRFNNRRYSANGRGGLFPLKLPGKDQREVELWYQLAAYLTENMMY
jgi:hypothetical protein